MRCVSYTILIFFSKMSERRHVFGFFSVLDFLRILTSIESERNLLTSDSTVFGFASLRREEKKRTVDEKDAE